MHAHSRASSCVRANTWDRAQRGRLTTRLGVVSEVLKRMSEEEEARQAWVRHHLRHGELAEAQSLGFSEH